MYFTSKRISTGLEKFAAMPPFRRVQHPCFAITWPPRTISFLFVLNITDTVSLPSLTWSQAECGEGRKTNHSKCFRKVMAAFIKWMLVKEMWYNSTVEKVKLPEKVYSLPFLSWTFWEKLSNGCVLLWATMNLLPPFDITSLIAPFPNAVQPSMLWSNPGFTIMPPPYCALRGSAKHCLFSKQWQHK